MDEPWKHYAKWKKPEKKGHRLYDSIYMKCPKYGNPDAESRCVSSGWGGKEGIEGDCWWVWVSF